MKHCLWALLLITATSFSADWTSTGTVTGIYIDLQSSKERILVRHSIPRADDDCHNNGNYYELKRDSAFSQEAYSYLLSLEARGENVKFLLDGCGATGFPLIQVINAADID